MNVISKSPRSSVVLVTPALADKWLTDHNGGNRKIVQSAVNRYAADMAAGRWLLGEAIVFGTDGNLLDGQHRLKAVVQAGILGVEGIEFFVQLGCPPSVMPHLNTGVVRKPKDAIRIAGYKLRYETNSIAIARMAIHAGEGNLDVIATNGGRALQNYEFLHFLENFGQENLERHAQRGTTAALSTPPVLASALGYAHMLFWGIHAEQAEAFFDRIVANVRGGNKDPLVRMQKTLETYTKPNFPLRPAQHLSVIIQAWNDERAGTWKIGRQTKGVVLYPADSFAIGAEVPKPV